MEKEIKIPRYYIFYCPICRKQKEVWSEKGVRVRRECCGKSMQQAYPVKKNGVQ